MQRYWRGYIVRLKNYRRTEAFNKTYQAACKIQSILRMRLCRKHFFPLRRFMKRLNQRYRVLLLFSRPRLRLGLVVKVLQKYARRFVFVMRRYYASIHLQRVYRGYYYRQKWLLLVYQLHTDKVNKIKRVWYLYTLRKKRKAELHRRHMAAYKIWVGLPHFCFIFVCYWFQLYLTRTCARLSNLRFLSTLLNLLFHTIYFFATCM